MVRPTRAALEKRCRFGILDKPIKIRGRTRYCKLGPVQIRRNIRAGQLRAKRKKRK